MSRKKVQDWAGVPKGWEELPFKYREKIEHIYKTNTRLKKGKTFKIGITITNMFPELMVVKGVSYHWQTWECTNEKWETTI